MFCKNCGKEIEADSKFCQHCGCATSQGGENNQDKQPCATKKNKKKKTRNILIAVAVPVIVLLILIGIFAPPTPETENETETQAVMQSETKAEPETDASAAGTQEVSSATEKTDETTASAKKEEDSKSIVGNWEDRDPSIPDEYKCVIEFYDDGSFRFAINYGEGYGLCDGKYTVSDDDVIKLEYNENDYGIDISYGEFKIVSEGIRIKDGIGLLRGNVLFVKSEKTIEDIGKEQGEKVDYDTQMELQSDPWEYFYQNGVEGYDASVNTGGKRLNVREGWGTDWDIKDQVEDGSWLHVYGEIMGWAFVKYMSADYHTYDYGWVSTDYIKADP